MGEIKDLIDLAVQLKNRAEQREFRTELQEIITELGKYQVERAELYDTQEKLKKELSSLKTKNNSLQEEVSSLKKCNKKTESETILGEEELKILLSIHKTKNQRISSIVSELNIGQGRVEYYLEKLSEHGFIDSPLAIDTERAYYIEQPGREYLFKNDLL